MELFRFFILYVFFIICLLFWCLSNELLVENVNSIYLAHETYAHSLPFMISVCFLCDCDDFWVIVIIWLWWRVTTMWLWWLESVIVWLWWLLSHCHYMTMMTSESVIILWWPSHHMIVMTCQSSYSCDDLWMILSSCDCGKFWVTFHVGYRLPESETSASFLVYKGLS